jgi:hypothetical protein
VPTFLERQQDPSEAAESVLQQSPRGRLLNAQAAAVYLGLPYTSFRDAALRGHVPIVRIPGSRRLWFDRRDIERLVDAWKERP